MQSADFTSSLAVLDRETIEMSIRRFNILRTDGQFDALSSYLAPDAVFEYPGDRVSFPYAGRYCGKAAIIDLLKRVNTEIQMLHCDTSDPIIDGDQAFSRRVVKVRHRGTGVREIHDIWDMWRFRHGLIVFSQKMVDISAYTRLQN